MAGFSYGGFGDGTTWSKERGTGPLPGGGSSGNSGNHSNTTPAEQKQINAIRADKNVRARLSNLIKAARKLNPSVKITVHAISPEGTMAISMEGLTATQARQAGLTGLVMGITVPGYIGSVGDFETGHKYNLKNPEKLNSIGVGTPLDGFNGGENIDTTPKKYRNWRATDEKSFYYVGTTVPMRLLHHLTVSRNKETDTYTMYFKAKDIKALYKIEVKNGDLDNMKLTTLAQGHPLFTAEFAKDIVRNFASVKNESDKEVLDKTSGVIISVGDKAGALLGEKYKALSREVASNIQNFQGKQIRTYDQAMASMNKLMTNPNMKIKAADKTAVINAWKAINVEDMGNKFTALGRAFKVADYVTKGNNVREKSITGYETGNWGPLMREVESWTVSGLTSSVALAVFSATLGAMLVAAGVSTAVVGIIGIIIAGLIGALIDDKFIDKLNNEIIRPAY
ncbi:TPA: hypothetical protein LVL00_001267 [Klebsiella oxytoca]|nr:hypothetical protein [Klebsiella oxytoca]